MVVGQHRRRSASARSWGVVTLKLAGEDSTTRTRPPARSTSQASSVACASTSSAHVERARAATSARNACGVWIAHRRERSCVRTTTPSVARLLDRVGHARGGDRGVGVARARRASREQLRRGPAGARRRGRRRPRRRRPRRARCAPTPSGSRRPRRARSRAGSRPPAPASASSAAAPCPGGTATTARGTPAAAIASSDQATIGRPARATNAFGRPAPSRSPLPAATTIAAERDEQLLRRTSRGPHGTADRASKPGGSC